MQKIAFSPIYHPPARVHVGQNMVIYKRSRGSQLSVSRNLGQLNIILRFIKIIDKLLPIFETLNLSKNPKKKVVYLGGAIVIFSPPLYHLFIRSGY